MLPCGLAPSLLLPSLHKPVCPHGRTPAFRVQRGGARLRELMTFAQRAASRLARSAHARQMTVAALSPGPNPAEPEDRHRVLIFLDTNVIAETLRRMPSHAVVARLVTQRCGARRVDGAAGFGKICPDRTAWSRAWRRGRVCRPGLRRLHGSSRARLWRHGTGRVRRVLNLSARGISEPAPLTAHCRLLLKQSSSGRAEFSRPAARRA
jgi:hypothetical protein